MNQPSPISFRQSHFLLIARLVFAELIIMVINLLLTYTHFFSVNFFAQTDAVQTITLANFFLFACISLFELGLLVYVTLTWANNEYEIRAGSIRHKHGILHIREELYSLRNLGSITITQTLLGRLLNYGSIHAYSPILKQDIHLMNIHNPVDMAKHIEDDVEHSGGKHEILRKI